MPFTRLPWDLACGLSKGFLIKFFFKPMLCTFPSPPAWSQHLVLIGVRVMIWVAELVEGVAQGAGGGFRSWHFSPWEYLAFQTCPELSHIISECLSRTMESGALVAPPDLRQGHSPPRYQVPGFNASACGLLLILLLIAAFLGGLPPSAAPARALWSAGTAQQLSGTRHQTSLARRIPPSAAAFLAHPEPAVPRPMASTPPKAVAALPLAPPRTSQLAIPFAAALALLGGLGLWAAQAMRPRHFDPRAEPVRPPQKAAIALMANNARRLREHEIEEQQWNTKWQLSGNLGKLQGNGHESLVDAIKKNYPEGTSLIVLNLLKAGSTILSEALPYNSTIRKLDLAGTSNHDGFGDFGCRALSSTLKLNFNLRSLILFNGNIGDPGMEFLADGLKYNEGVQTLFLYRNLIGDVGAIALADALKLNRTVHTIYLQYNQISDAGAAALAAALKRNSSVKHLDLANNRIHNKAILESIAASLERNRAGLPLPVNNDPPKRRLPASPPPPKAPEPGYPRPVDLPPMVQAEVAAQFPGTEGSWGPDAAGGDALELDPSPTPPQRRGRSPAAPVPGGPEAVQDHPEHFASYAGRTPTPNDYKVRYQSLGFEPPPATTNAGQRGAGQEAAEAEPAWDAGRESEVQDEAEIEDWKWGEEDWGWGGQGGAGERQWPSTGQAQGRRRTGGWE